MGLLNTISLTTSCIATFRKEVVYSLFLDFISMCRYLLVQSCLVHCLPQSLGTLVLFNYVLHIS